ncbi:MAG TPA: hypothetical protein VJJ21_02305 [Candidatus Nanoarchaeia archaeon]|nr:hypothetical protein [Candidatus Nanoarchaeia archaeon]
MNTISQTQNLPWSKSSGYKQQNLIERGIERIRQTKPIKMLRKTQLEMLQGFKEAGEAK